jgi:hypothetical protein
MLVGDFSTGWIRLIGLDDSDAVIYDQSAGHMEGVSSWAVGPDGYLFVSNYGSTLASPYKTGSIYRAIAIDE